MYNLYSKCQAEFIYDLRPSSVFFSMSRFMCVEKTDCPTGLGDATTLAKNIFRFSLNSNTLFFYFNKGRQKLKEKRLFSNVQTEKSSGERKEVNTSFCLTRESFLQKSLYCQVL